MSQPVGGPNDEQVERFMAVLLRTGVITAAVVVLAGGIIYLMRHGAETLDKEDPDIHKFTGESAQLTHPVGIVTEAVEPRGRGLIQLGLLLLIATPVARVVFSVFAFLRQRDRLYVVLTLVVLTVLLVSLFFGRYFGMT
jgi:uncharacterized membrane protein